MGHPVYSRNVGYCSTGHKWIQEVTCDFTCDISSHQPLGPQDLYLHESYILQFKERPQRTLEKKKRTKAHQRGPGLHSQRAVIHPYVSDSSILALTFSNPLSESASSFVSTSKPLGRGHWDKTIEPPRQIIWWLSRIHLHYAAVMKEGQSALVVSFCKPFTDRPSRGQWQDKDKPWIERTDNSERSEMSLSPSLFHLRYSTVVQLWTRTR